MWTTRGARVSRAASLPRVEVDARPRAQVVAGRPSAADATHRTPDPSGGGAVLVGFLARVKFEGGRFSGNSATGFGSAVSATSNPNHDDGGVWASYVLAVDVESNDGTWAVAEGSTIDLEGSSEDEIDLVDVRPIVSMPPTSAPSAWDNPFDDNGDDGDDGATCEDTDDGAVDSDGYGCSGYYGYEDYCGTYDIMFEFDSRGMCCACGGGNRDDGDDGGGA